jgi:hypothetical protein
VPGAWGHGGRPGGLAAPCPQRHGAASLRGRWGGRGLRPLCRSPAVSALWARKARAVNPPGQRNNLENISRAPSAGQSTGEAAARRARAVWQAAPASERDYAATIRGLELPQAARHGRLVRERPGRQSCRRLQWTCWMLPPAVTAARQPSARGRPVALSCELHSVTVSFPDARAPGALHARVQFGCPWAQARAPVSWCARSPAEFGSCGPDCCVTIKKLISATPGRPAMAWTGEHWRAACGAIRG